MKKGHSFPSDLGFTGSARGFARGGAVKAALIRHMKKAPEAAHPDAAVANMAAGGVPRLRRNPTATDFVTTDAPTAPKPILKGQPKKTGRY